MRKAFHLLVAGVIVFAGCTKENQLIDPAATDIEPTLSHLESASLVAITKGEEVLDKVLESVGSNKSLVTYIPQLTMLLNEPLFGTDWQLEQYYLVYNTVDINGNPIKLSGDIAFINEAGGKVRRELSSIFVFHSMFNTDDYQEKLLNSSKNMEYIIMPIRAMHNDLVVYPHYQGVGVDNDATPVLSEKHHSISPSEPVLKARQAIDLELAAIEFINSYSKTHNLSLSDCYITQNVGISNGASTAVAFQYLIENDKDLKDVQDDIRLYGTYAAEGCYNIANTIKTIVNGADDLQSSRMYDIYPYAYTTIVAGSYATHKDDVYNTYGVDSVERYFSDAFNSSQVPYKDAQVSILDYFYSGNLSMYVAISDENDIIKNAGINMSNIVNESLLDPETHLLDESNNAVKALLNALNHDTPVIRGEIWSCATPLRMVHSTGDEFLPYSDALEVYDNLSNHCNNKNVTFDTIFGLRHAESSIVLLLRDCCLRKYPTLCK